ncbi:DUF1840 domain-containing protein [Comamonas antarctica]|uniref:DUF1840 domain-containing protein n=1 Tax=Comamonas antarctica TaxID=2743470 RepID=A0A6N1WWT0_9BURK|nr:DUF1840 domain-containing protein [Comamonas antarctica]QKV51679.1 DUF1840 domain-containing protein [Comamonas antarctica]
MPYKFKSRATADLIMLDATARRLLEIVGKDTEGPGIITAEQIPGALAALEQAVRAEEARRAEAQQDEDEQDHGDATAKGEGVSLRQRTAPFVDMLKRSAAEGRDVTW